MDKLKKRSIFLISCMPSLVLALFNGAASLFLYLRHPIVLNPAELRAFSVLPLASKQLFFSQLLFIQLLTILLLSIFFGRLALSLMNADRLSKEMAFARRAMLNLPLVNAGAIIVSWLAVIVITLLFAFEHDILPVTQAKLISLTLLAVLVIFLVSFYIVDRLNKRFILPDLMHGVPMREYTRFMLKIGVGVRFRIFFFSVSFFPLFFLLSLYLSFIYEYRRYDLIFDSLAIVALMIMISSLLTTIFVRSIQHPLELLRSATDRIRRGEFDYEICMYSRDEFGVLADTLNKTLRDLKEKAHIEETFGVMVDPVVRDHVLRGGLKLGGELKMATFLYTDIRNFTGMSENRAPDTVVEIINSYFRKMSQCIASEHGIVNKYIGDAMLAVFGDPVAIEDPVGAALRASIVMRRDLRSLNEELEGRGLPSIDAGVSIHTGGVLAGNIGSANRMDYTYIGDAVNVVARIEKLTKMYQIPILITESSYYFLMFKKFFHAREIDNVRVKGRNDAVKVYEIYDCDPPETKQKKDETKEKFVEMLALYQAGNFEDAAEGFEEIVTHNPADTVAKLYATRCFEQMVNAPLSWDGVTEIYNF